MNTPTFPEESHLPEKEQYSIEEIDSIDVNFCNTCHSLKIMIYSDDPSVLYCDNCFGTDIGQSSIEEWEKIENKRKGPRLIKK